MLSKIKTMDPLSYPDRCTKKKKKKRKREEKEKKREKEEVE